MQHYERPKGIPTGPLPPGADELLRQEELRERLHRQYPHHSDPAVEALYQKAHARTETERPAEDLVPPLLHACTTYKQIMYWALKHYDRDHPSRTAHAIQGRLREIGDRSDAEGLTTEEVRFLDRYAGRRAPETDADFKRLRLH